MLGVGNRVLFKTIFAVYLPVLDNWACLSVTCRYHVKWTDERIQLIFGTVASIGLGYAVF